jgi:hypothetical protein
VACSDIFGTAGSAWLDALGLPQPYAGKVTSLRQLTGELATEITMLGEVTADLLAGDCGYRVIQQLPGIGPVLAAIILAEIGHVTRVKNSGQLCSWAGLTPRHLTSMCWDTDAPRGTAAWLYQYAWRVSPPDQWNSAGWDGAGACRAGLLKAEPGAGGAGRGGLCQAAPP